MQATITWDYGFNRDFDIEIIEIDRKTEVYPNFKVDVVNVWFRFVGDRPKNTPEIVTMRGFPRGDNKIVFRGSCADSGYTKTIRMAA